MRIECFDPEKTGQSKLTSRYNFYGIRFTNQDSPFPKSAENVSYHHQHSTNSEVKEAKHAKFSSKEIPANIRVWQNRD